MNKIKQHIFEVVCGLVIVAALSTYFLWTSWDNATTDAALVRNGNQASVKKIIQTPTPMPGCWAAWATTKFTRSVKITPPSRRAARASCFCATSLDGCNGAAEC